MTADADRAERNRLTALQAAWPSRRFVADWITCPCGDIPRRVERPGYCSCRLPACAAELEVLTDDLLVCPRCGAGFHYRHEIQRDVLEPEENVDLFFREPPAEVPAMLAQRIATLNLPGV